ncbi:MAG: methyltransferase domain-containing protein [Erysipelotrichaceae bacterium]
MNNILRCPKCNEPLILNNKSFICLNKHCYDLSKTNYLNLYKGNYNNNGDSKEMIKARTSFLNNNYYSVLADKLNDIISSIKPLVIVDAACGEGYYTNLMSFNNPLIDMYGVDLSKDAILHGSKANSNVQYIVGSIYDMPFNDNSVDLVFNIFAPTPDIECNRILNSNGYLVIVDPDTYHLQELRDVMYDKPYNNIVDYKVYPNFELVNHYNIASEIYLNDSKDIQDLLMMTPYYWKSSKDAIDRVKALDSLSLTIGFVIKVYKKK